MYARIVFAILYLLRVNEKHGLQTKSLSIYHMLRDIRKQIIVF